jgi:hypothetical protein
MKQLLTLLLCMILTAGAAQAQDGAYRFEKGKEYKYLIEETSLSMQEMPGQTISVNGETTLSAVYSLVGEAENGNLNMQVTIDNALVISEGPNGTNTFGNDMIGKSVQFELATNGDVVDVDSSIRAIDSEGVGLLILAANFFPKLDGSKLATGSSWTTTSVDTSGEGDNQRIEETERKYEVGGTKMIGDRECLEITLNSESEIEGKGVSGDQQLTITGSRKGKGTIMYDAKEGVLVSYAAEIAIDQSIFFPANNMRIPITATRNVKAELTTK